MALKLIPKGFTFIGRYFPVSFSRPFPSFPSRRHGHPQVQVQHHQSKGCHDQRPRRVCCPQLLCQGFAQRNSVCLPYLLSTIHDLLSYYHPIAPTASSAARFDLPCTLSLTSSASLHASQASTPLTSTFRPSTSAYRIPTFTASRLVRFGRSMASVRVSLLPGYGSLHTSVDTRLSLPARPLTTL